MGRTPCCVKVGLNRGPWTAEEDIRLSNYVETHGEGGWRTLPSKAGLLRCGKSCRLRWMNYLRPNVKRGRILPEEEDLILRLHRLLGNRWSLIAGRMPGRTDNEIKNYWNTHLSKKLITQGIDPRTHKPLSAISEESDVSLNSQLENFAGISEEKETATAVTEVEGGGSAPCPQDIRDKQNIIAGNYRGSSQISVSQFMNTVPGRVGGVAHHHAHDNYAYIISKAASFNGEWNSSTEDAPFQKQQVSQGLQAQEMELHNSGIVPAYSKLSNNTSCTAAAAAAAANGFSFPFPYPITTTTCMGSGFGDCSSDYMFSSLLESFGNEELQVSEATAAADDVTASAPHEPCPLNQPDHPANLSYDLWSLLSPSPTMSQYHPST